MLPQFASELYYYLY